MVSLAGLSPLIAGSVSGRVELRDSQDAAVRKHMDFSGVVVWLEPVNGSAIPAPPGAAAKMVQKDKTFTPHVLPIRVGTSVDFPNFDPIFHNVFSLSKPKNFDLGNYSKGQTRMVVFLKPGIVAVYCHLHPNMAGTIVVTPNQWSVCVDTAGQYALANVPPGKYTVVAWHKTGGTFRKTIEVAEGRDSVADFFVPLAEIASGELDNHAALHPGH